MRHLSLKLSTRFTPPITMRLIFLFLFAIAAALNSAHAHTPLAFTSNATLPSSPAGSPASIPVQITGGTPPYSFALKCQRGRALIIDIWAF